MRDKKIEVRLNSLEYDWLKAYADKEQIPMAEAVRRFMNKEREKNL